MLTSYAYTSIPCRTFQANDLRQILATARQRNSEIGVTGILYSDAGCFFHVIEGEEPVLAKLMSRILRDPRHSQVTILDQVDLTERLFGDFSLKHIDGRENTALHGGVSFQQLVHGGADYVAARIRELTNIRLFPAPIAEQVEPSGRYAVR